MFQIVKHRYWYFLLSALVLVPGAVSFLLYGVPRSIDFTGGALYEVQFENPDAVSEADIRAVYADSGVGEVQVIEAVNNYVRHQIRSADVSPAQKDAISDGLAEAIGPFEELRFESIGPSVGALVTRNAAIAVIMASIGILAYLTVQFRGVPHPVRYGVCAILAMLHDVLLVVGLASLAGLLFGWE
ncbi:MAG: protein translocase subunit SecF, partial [Anaerolineae bacterium]